MVTLSHIYLGLLSLWAVRGEVGTDFSKCTEFFFRETPVFGLNIALPTPVKPNTHGLVKPDEKCLSAYKASSPAYICQRYNGEYHFATLYDRRRRIPLYSAYKMDINGQPKRYGSIVNYEPQLVHLDLPDYQMNINDSIIAIKKYNKIHNCKNTKIQYEPTYKLNWSQALNDDYVRNPGKYDRGHLNPAGHHRKGNSSNATMTFTNVAPQNRKMNSGQWNQYEKKLKEDLSKGCSKMYVVTGVVPGSTWLKKNKRVNVPSHYWNAFCCTDNNGKPIRSGGALCLNTAESEVIEYDKIKKLQNELKKHMNVDSKFQIFNNCLI